VYVSKNGRFYHAEIWVNGKQYRRSTGETSRRKAVEAARKIEEDLIEQAEAEAEAGTSLQLKDVGTRYMAYIGDFHAGANNTERLVALLLKFFNPNKLITDITQDDVLALRAWRRKQHTGPKLARRPISAATVNDTIEQLKKLFTYVKTSPHVRFEHEPKWSELWLDEPEITPRELSPEETARLLKALAATRPDYRAVFEFAWFSLKRKTEIFTLQWSHVKWDHGLIERPGKGDKGGSTSPTTSAPSSGRSTSAATTIAGCLRRRTTSSPSPPSAPWTR